MRYLVNSRQAKAIDTYTIEMTGIPSLVLMERASLAVASCVEEMAASMGGRKAAICSVCGMGNNGGDGIAAARILYGRGYDVTIALAGDREKMSIDAKRQLEIAEKLSVPIVNDRKLQAYNIIIDALFGIGLTRDVEGDFAEWITAVNHASSEGARVCAVDIPSGISTDTGAVMGTAVRADVTVTFGYMKLGMIFYPGASYSGKIVCEDIGFDKQAESEAGLQYVTYTQEDEQRMPKRRPDSNKGTYGRVLIVAGSRNMAGAAWFSAKAAYRMGTGLVTIYTAESNRMILQQLLPDAVMKTYEDGTPDMTVLSEQIKNHRVIVVGPGLGRSEAAQEIVRTVMAQAKGTLIIDADALNIVAEHEEWLKGCQADAAVTPHMMELSRLTGHNIQYLKENLVQVCEEFRQHNGVICISKDARTMIFDGSENIYVNTTGNNGMSVGGSGDVLTGVIAGLCAQGMALNDASRLGVYLHGRAGDIAAGRMGMHAMTASDMIDALPELLKNIEKNTVMNG